MSLAGPLARVVRSRRAAGRPILAPLLARHSSRSTGFARPGPPPLPPAEQAEFEQLVKRAQVSVPLDAIPAAPDSPAARQAGAGQPEGAAAQLHPDARRGPGREFEGEVNPRTGEIGGPKRDPFLAGDNDWQYGGRVTDF